MFALFAMFSSEIDRCETLERLEWNFVFFDSIVERDKIIFAMIILWKERLDFLH